MTRRILAIIAGVILPPIGIVIFGVGAQQSLGQTFRYAPDPEPSFGWLWILLGVLIVAAGIGAGYWSGLGLAIAGGLGVVFGFLQFAFPISLGSFNIGLWLVLAVGGPLPREAPQALLTVIYLGGPLTIGALLLGAGIGLSRRRRATAPSALWQVIGVAAMVAGIPLVIAAQSLLIDSLRIARVDPVSTVVLVLAAAALGLAAYSSRGAGLALVVGGGVVAVAGLAVVAVPGLFFSPSSLVHLSQQHAYLFSQGYPVLFGGLLLATGVVSLLLGRNRADAVPAPAV